ncbi:unnamed protein product [Hermetia illucens]|uniref:Uncharacterized protein n=1 Tax=Hermetia illucens TaxID=343691 RepID=A0A7R8UZR3_HERIL|nr:uncharacterized protein LOC119656589 [Hermetia illucens]CAD7090130.1 unnamed protein product [Hermetia illucens]
MDPLKLLFTILLSGFLFNEVSGLECYVCTNQSNNVEKCLNTIKTCEQGEDTCLTEIRWGSTPYWSEGAPKQYYVSKRCSTKSECAATRKRYMPYCTHIWYEDWTCSECCRGDRCNYYIINGSSHSQSNVLLAIGLFIFGCTIAMA